MMKTANLMKKYKTTYEFDGGLRDMTVFVGFNALKKCWGVYVSYEKAKKGKTHRVIREGTEDRFATKAEAEQALKTHAEEAGWELMSDA